MRALVLDAEGRTADVQDIRLPVPASHEIFVRVEAISLNPIDSLYVAHPLASSGRTIGSDFSGTVAAVGSQVPSTEIVYGDRVAGFLQGACSVNDRPGAFAEYLVVPWDLVWRVPDSLTIEEAAGVSLVALTAAQGVWYRLGPDAPFAYVTNSVKQEHPHDRLDAQPDTINFLVYGASTSVGLYTAQLARLSARPSGRAIKLFGVASKARWSLLKAEPYNYDYLVDYRDSDWHEQIWALSAGEGMHYVYDAISEGDTVRRNSSTLAPNGRMAIVRSREGGAWIASNMSIEPIYGAVWEGLGEEVQYQGFTVQKSPAARNFAVQFYRWLSTAVGSELKPVSIRLMPGGLNRVVDDGLELLGAGIMEERRLTREEVWMRPVSAEKLVYRIQDSLNVSESTA
ncbi:GroES-like protein [Macroventuria anomochaeta]|uniref:GroES-like protein n=1 Tax=Macroventuria anomochaeta TaxID=301207 RepID=A0ACB6RUA6_9PLEO|nr:GroES-like protein [Macroventuria anomochaeta]KAF2624457.1 GroES-like protein [Macroventuria anomochaeta]